MTDLITRLRAKPYDKDKQEAADTITALQKRVKELEGALEPFAKQAQKWKDAQMHFGADPPPEEKYIQATFRRMYFDAARAALKGGE